ncbi:MAG: hypothetical protein HY744_31850 [Deltaproteobacteria bacterium]|nr:hypothetical protein [Deltaproteobacteria bacterium]
MSGGVPHEHVFAEIAAFPFGSEAAFYLGIAKLRGDLDGDTGKLWRELEGYLEGRSGGRSLDLLVAMRDLAWLGRPWEGTPVAGACARPEPVALGSAALGDVLQRLAERLLADRGERATVRERWDDAAAPGPVPATAWRWLGFAMPEDMLLCGLARACRSRGPLPAGRVCNPLSVLQRRVLDHGAAEVHLHLGAAHDFRTLWAATLRALACDDVKDDALRSPGAVLGEGRLLAPWLLAAAIARQLLAGLMRESREPDAPRPLGIFDYVASLSLLPASLRVDVLLVLGDLLQPATTGPSLDFPALQHVYRQITGFGTTIPPPPARFDVVQQHCDPVACFYQPVGDVTPEMQWLARALQAGLEAVEERLLWQIVRLRCMYFRHVTQRPMTSGLQWFTRFYARMGKMRDPIERVLVESAACVDTGGLWRGLRSLEGRVVPEEEIARLKDKVGAHLRSWRHARRRLVRGGESHPEFGLVLHFVKRRGNGWEKGLPAAGWCSTNAEPGFRGAQFRYQQYFLGVRRQALALADLFCQEPEILWFVRGIDVATDELGVPTWIFAPLFHFVRERAEAAIATLAGAPRRPEPLRATAHCGEDFVHLLGGLRRVDEALNYLASRSGDRLGHALALGEDPARWAEARSAVVMGAEDRLWDLVWEWDLRTRRGPIPPSGRTSWLERSIRELSREIFPPPEPPSAAQLVEVRRYLFDSLVDKSTLGPTAELGFTYGTGRDAPTWLAPDEELAELALDLLTDPRVFERGQRLVRVDLASNGEIESLEAISALLRADACKRELAIEVNPSSNLLIGDLLQLDYHPMLRLRPIEGGSAPILVAIGSDDPLTFATSLPEEYELMHQALLSRCSNGTLVEQWLDRAREDALGARFTLDPPAGILARLIGRLSGGRWPGADRTSGPDLPAPCPFAPYR